MNGDASTNDDEQQWKREAREEFAAQDRANRRHGNQVIAYAVVFATTIFVLFLIVPHWARIILGLALAGWGFWGLWNQRPGHCVICGRRTLLNGPSSTYKDAPPYMYWRPQPRHMNTYFCPEHMGQVMLERISEPGG